MNLHSSTQYPFVKYIVEEFSGAFYENDFTSLNRILILYHNRYSFTVQPNNISAFLALHEQGLSEPDWFYFYFWGEKRRRIRQVRHRTAFVLRHNPGLLEVLLSRKDYGSEQAALETLKNILDWLQTLPGEVVADKSVDLDGWKSELKQLTAQTMEPKQAIRRTARTGDGSKFHELLTGKDEAEKIVKFNRLKMILLKEQWIMVSSKADQYTFFKDRSGGRFYIVALYYVLCEKGHVERKPEATEIAALFNSWLVHFGKQSSFVKAFQPHEFAKFDCRKGEAKFKYVSEARLVLRDF